MIEFLNITKKYDDVLLKNVGLSIGSREIIAIIGKNGTGKSTLLNIICGLIDSDTNMIIKKDNNILSKNVDIGYYSSLNYMNVNFTIYQNYYYYCKFNDIDLDIIDEVLCNFNIKKYKNKKFKECSLGIKSLSKIGLALLGNHELIILDEPTNSLDSNKKQMLIKCINNYKKASFIIVSHDFDFLKEISNKVFLLEDGNLRKIYRSKNLHIKVYENDKLRKLLEEREINFCFEDQNNNFIIKNCDKNSIIKLLIKNNLDIFYFEEKEYFI